MLGTDVAVFHFDQIFRRNFLNEKAIFGVGLVDKCRLKVEYRNN